MGWTMLYLFVFLKLPICALGYIVWWAVHQDGEETPVKAGSSDGGGPRPAGPHPHPRAPFPRPARRGPHGDRQPAAPARVRRATPRMLPRTPHSPRAPRP